MHVLDIFEETGSRIVAIYPGRFQPFHRGHRAVFDYLSKTFGAGNTFITTSDKVGPPKSPFNFDEKLRMMTLTGVDPSRVVKTAEPYRANELVSQLDPNTRLIFAVSQKDMDEDPRFAKWTKKDGSPSYFQPAPKDLSQMGPMSEHAYIYVVPTFPFKIGGQNIQSATQVRSMFAQGTEEQRKALVKELFGAYDEDVYQIMAGKITEGWKSKLAGAALAGAAAMSPAPASALDAGDVFVAGRVATNIGKMDRHDVRSIADQELQAIVRGDKNRSWLSNYGRTAPTVNAVEVGKDLESTKQRALQQLERRSGKSVDPSSVHFDIDEPRPGVYKVTATTKMNEEAAGVGVIASKKQAKDPRYSMSLTRDVRPGQVQKSLKAFRLAENAEELNIGDEVIITGAVQYKGATGRIDSFGDRNRFVVVDLYNHGKHSFHSSDVSYNDYADSDEEEADMYDRDEDFRRWNSERDMDEGMYQYDKEDPFNSEFAPAAGMGRMTLRAWKQSLARRVRQMADKLDSFAQPEHIDKSALWDDVYRQLKALNLDPIAQEIELAHQELEKIRRQGGVRSRAFQKLSERISMLEKWSEKYKRSINCSNPRGFSQRAHCAGRKKK
jgi:hypothetical protein